MILRRMVIHECWCSKCSKGQMEQIHQITFNEKIQIHGLIGRKIKCSNCGEENIIEDVLDLIPESFLVFSNNELSKYKSNQELNNWLNSDDTIGGWIRIGSEKDLPDNNALCWYVFNGKIEMGIYVNKHFDRPKQNEVVRWDNVSHYKLINVPELPKEQKTA